MSTGACRWPSVSTANTATWQLSTLPRWPHHCRATPTECSPCLTKLLSSTHLIHADGQFASYSSLKGENFPGVARDESKQLADRLRRRRFTQGVTYVPRQIIEFLRC